MKRPSTAQRLDSRSRLTELPCLFCAVEEWKWRRADTATAAPEAELRRYDAVIFFETAAVGGASIEGGNPMRNESLEEAMELDGRLRKLWARHPRFVLVPNNRSFFKKLTFGLAALESIVSQLTCDATCTPATAKRTRGSKGP